MNNLFLYRRDYTNPGDIWSSPVHYLHERWQGIELDVNRVHYLENREFDNVFIGGGAIFTVGHWIRNLDRTLKNIKFKNLIYWGAGRGLDHQFPFVQHVPTLAGSREWEPGYFSDYTEWVPCASVFHTKLQKLLNEKHNKDFLVVDHWKREPIVFPAEHSRINNNPQTLDQMLLAISEHKWILTTSYHAAYWATLLNKRVIVLRIDNPDNKFRAFKHPPVISRKFNWELVGQAKNYSEAYEECLAANLRFRDKVYSL